MTRKTKAEAKCQNPACKKTFTYNACNSRGKYCSNSCRGDHAKVLKLASVSNKAPCSGRTMKQWLKETRGEKCEECGQGPEWNDKPLVLQLDHKDGNSDNTTPKNCRLLCPNCHTQTPNFGAKGNGNRYKKDTKRNRYLQSYKK